MAFNCHCSPENNERAERAVSTKAQEVLDTASKLPTIYTARPGAAHLSSRVLLATCTRRPTYSRELCSWVPQGFHLPAIQAVSKGPLIPSSQVSAQTLQGIKKSSANLQCQKYKWQRTRYCSELPALCLTGSQRPCTSHWSLGALILGANGRLPQIFIDVKPSSCSVFVDESYYLHWRSLTTSKREKRNYIPKCYFQ